MIPGYGKLSSDSLKLVRLIVWSLEMLKLLKQIHADEKGSVSIETILIIAAIAIPILIFILKFGWPRIKAFFDEGMDDLDSTRESVVTGTSVSQ